jgi:molecular chaperone IbpA
MDMNTFDFSPFFRSTVGFDRVFDLLDEATRSDEVSWPPYNIEKLGEDTYRITMAVAGFSQEDLSVVAHENTLIVTGKLKNGDMNATQYLYRGIAGRGFERRFNMADHVKVAGASLVNGLLHIELKREVPEAMKPRTIAIQSGSGPKAIEARAA